MQQLLDTPGFAAVVVTLLGALATLLLAVAGYVSVKTEQARQGERMAGLQHQINQLPAQPNGPLSVVATPQAQAPPVPVATTVLTLPANGTALHIEAVRATTAPAGAPAAPAPEQTEAPPPAATTPEPEPPPGHAPDGPPNA